MIVVIDKKTLFFLRVFMKLKLSDDIMETKLPNGMTPYKDFTPRDSKPYARVAVIL
jgi:hypothetical protein